MNITMISTQHGSEDGIRIQKYTEGVEYSMGATLGQIDLARAFVAAGMAVEQGVNEEGGENSAQLAVKKTKATK